MSEIIKVMDTIDALNGMEEFKQLARKLNNISTNSRRLATPVPLPNFLFLSDESVGTTTHIRLLANLLSALGLHRFQGERRFFEMVLDKDAFHQGGGFDRLLHEVNRMAGFYDQFCGVIGLEMDSWVRDADDADLDRLVSFADAMHGRILFVFEVRMKNRDRVSPLVKRLSMSAPLEVVNFPMPGVEELKSQMQLFLRRRGFTVNADALKCLENALVRMTALEDFDGYQTLTNLADEIVYQHLSGEETPNRVITAESLAFIDAEDGFISRLTRRTTRSVESRRIGF